MVYTNQKRLIADSIKELHSFAESIDLKKIWYRGRVKYPYYIIYPPLVTLALAHGAKLMTDKDFKTFKNQSNGIFKQRKISIKSIKENPLL